MDENIRELTQKSGSKWWSKEETKLKNKLISRGKIEQPMLLGYQLKQTQQILVSTNSINDVSYTPWMARFLSTVITYSLL